MISKGFEYFVIDNFPCYNRSIKTSTQIFNSRDLDQPFYIIETNTEFLLFSYDFANFIKRMSVILAINYSSVSHFHNRIFKCVWVVSIGGDFCEFSFRILIFGFKYFEKKLKTNMEYQR